MITIPQTVTAWTARPTRLEEVASMLRFAAERHRTVLPRGAGSKAGWRPSSGQAEVLVSTSNLSDWSYEPGSDVVTIGAGVPVAVAQARLATFGRRLPIDPPSPNATIGGALATDEVGPLSELYGTPMEALVGAWGVRSGGTIVRVGETDLAFGPVGHRYVESHTDPHLRWLRHDAAADRGVLVNATFRVTRIPPARRWISREVMTPMEAFELLQVVRERGLAPSAVEFNLPAGGRGQIAVLIEGSLESGMDRAAEVMELFSPGAHYSDLPPIWWGRYPWRGDEVALRFSASPMALRSTPYAIRDAAGVSVAMRGSLGMGLLHAAVPADLPAERLTAVLRTAKAVLHAHEGRMTVLSAPAELAVTVADFRRD
ncbi:glycolate oxidase FAD binding subunit [Allocatelliglobosispora scoriae]|uniref:Glycolate oxidase FAD binding subunit n=1 Tax=Allocatelliglobosispora scoriae TaxID=643052 RepID=A0A841BTP4_9ACTN|nr:FAD-binding oxidoreductase [Allocatelliglobosispora scoriae]MBB5870796.1 glycolate oxidase FAD binding subunit [Allocatelliglobosispora scoriae]